MKNTYMTEAIMKAIKAHNAERDEFLAQFNKNIKIKDIRPYTGNLEKFGNTYHCEYPNEAEGDYTTCIKYDDIYMRLLVDCSFKPANKYDNNTVQYEVMMISTGEIVIYFNGTRYDY